MTCVPRLVRNRSGSSAAEFALVLPMLLALIFMVIDGGRYLWSVNRIEKATQWGARFAVVTDPVPGALASYTFVSVSLPQGTTIPASAMADITCDQTSCSCVAGSTGACPNGSFSTAAFTAIVSRMQLISPDIGLGNVKVIYRGSGVGFSGDPSGMQIAPLVTIQVSGVTWAPVSGFAQFKAGFPTIETTLSAEDSIGSSSY